MNRVLLQDLAWAIVIGVVVGVGPHVPGDRLDLEILAIAWSDGVARARPPRAEPILSLLL